MTRGKSRRRLSDAACSASNWSCAAATSGSPKSARARRTRVSSRSPHSVSRSSTCTLAQSSVFRWMRRCVRRGRRRSRQAGAAPQPHAGDGARQGRAGGHEPPAAWPTTILFPRRSRSSYSTARGEGREDWGREGEATGSGERTAWRRRGWVGDAHDLGGVGRAESSSRRDGPAGPGKAREASGRCARGRG